MITDTEDRSRRDETGERLAEPLVADAYSVAQHSTAKWLPSGGEGCDNSVIELVHAGKGLFAGGGQREMSVAAEGGDEP